MCECLNADLNLSGLSNRFPRHDPALIAEIFGCAVRAVQASGRELDARLLIEVEELAHTLEAARAEIVAIGADDIRVSHIPSATDELDAIVAHTATATNSILEGCEQLDRLSLSLEVGNKQVIQRVVTQMYEACSFQDITGQRVTKVVSTLQMIERKVAHMISVFTPTRLHGERPSSGVATSSSLLNGPQLAAAAMDQADIDALMASLD